MLVERLGLVDGLRSMLDGIAAVAAVVQGVRRRWAARAPSEKDRGIDGASWRWEAGI